MMDNLLIFTSCYPPGFKGGGPAKSISNLAEYMAKRGRKIFVFTSDRDVGESTPYQEISQNIQTERNGVFIIYMRRALHQYLNCRKIVREERVSCIYLNELFSIRFTLVPLLYLRYVMRCSQTIVVAPRGALGEGALAIKKWRKKLVLVVTKSIGLYRGIKWHATASTEEKEIRRNIGCQANVFVAPNFAEYKPMTPTLPAENTIRIVFLSRISKKKNLLGLIKNLARVNYPVELSIHGPIEDRQYWKDCMRVLDVLPEHVSWKYQGPASPEVVRTILNRSDIFALLSHHENFGHVVVEALSAACPVLISDKTPWLDIERFGAGWVVDLDKPELVAKCIAAYGSKSSGQKIEMKSKAISYYKKWVKTENTYTILNAELR